MDSRVDRWHMYIIRGMNLGSHTNLGVPGCQNTSGHPAPHFGWEWTRLCGNEPLINEVPIPPPKTVKIKIGKKLYVMMRLDELIKMVKLPLMWGYYLSIYNDGWFWGIKRVPPPMQITTSPPAEVVINAISGPNWNILHWTSMNPQSPPPIFDIFEFETQTASPIGIAWLNG